ncbi:hypothetical protein GXW83_24435 [Streptacidiphilus sp. PB12-B1b]|uniref:hypothetical protein n=1 Tax=Streptacidiphilus sp. PB12-B1b TaxID=2705012 RepID=UPI0015FD4724|nr:hypothetical protein [Streptacidiphilus sp. PB12-B1b]QMU78386.1 hypothetical protein GXW83_24435 [Streptacidiphilus sp. PB12-B1b]
MLTFEQLKAQAFKKVLAGYPGAELLEADGTSPVFSPSTITPAPEHMLTWRFVFHAAGGGTVFAPATAGTLGELQYVDQPWLEDRTLAPDYELTLAGATKLLEQHGCMEPYQNVTLRWPLGPQLGEPLFIFGFPPQAYVAVGINSRTVSPLE